MNQIEEIKNNNEIYYKIYKKDNKLNVVCMQWFDEFDYNEEDFIKSNNGEDLKFYNEDEANKYLEILDKHNNQPDYKSAFKDFVNYFKYDKDVVSDNNALTKYVAVLKKIEELVKKYNLGGE